MLAIVAASALVIGHNHSSILPPQIFCECGYIHVDWGIKFSYEVDAGNAVFSSIPADITANAVALVFPFCPEDEFDMCPPTSCICVGEPYFVTNQDVKVGDLLTSSLAVALESVTSNFLIGLPGGDAEVTASLSSTSGSVEKKGNIVSVICDWYEGPCDQFCSGSALALGNPISNSAVRWVVDSGSMNAYDSNNDFDMTLEMGDILTEAECRDPYSVTEIKTIKTIYIKGYTLKSTATSSEVVDVFEGAIAIQNDGSLSRIGSLADAEFDPVVNGRSLAIQGSLGLSLDTTDLLGVEEISVNYFAEDYAITGNADRDLNDQVSWSDRMIIIDHIGEVIGSIGYDARCDIDLDGTIDAYDLIAFNTVPCSGDFNNDGVGDVLDDLDYYDAYANELPIADTNGDGIIDILDLLDYFASASIGCP